MNKKATKKKVVKIRSKKYDEKLPQVDKNKSYSMAEACQLVKELSTTKFDGAIEAHLRLNFDTSKDSVRGTVSLPHGSGKTKRIIVFADDKLATEAKKAGAIEAGNKDLITKIESGWLDFDIAIAHPQMMPEVGKLGKILGTKGLMPNPKAGTISPDVVKAVQAFAKGMEQFKADSFGIVHAGIGRVSFDANQITENLQAVIDAVKKVKPAKTKGQFFVSLHLAPSMGPSVKIDINEVK
ncbi:MAG: 50S ribosomal protein L1 [Patescibacteria group bacterium]